MYNAYKAADHDVIGLAHSRATDRLKKLDLTDFTETDSFFAISRPDCERCVSEFAAPSNKESEGVIHCAAERRPGILSPRLPDP